MTRRRRLGMLAAALLLTSRIGLGERASSESGLSLFWPAVAGCPSGSEVLADITRLLGGAIPASPVLEATVTIRRTRSWVLELVIVRDGARGERTLEGDTCSSVAHAAALILAMAIAPERVQADALPAPTRSAGPPPAAPPRAEVAPARGSSRPLPGTGGLAVGPAYLVGVYPSPILGAWLEADWRWHRLGLFAGGGYWPQRRFFAQNHALGGHFSVGSGEIAAGYALSEEPVTALPRAGVGLGHLSARGFDSGGTIRTKHQQSDFWFLVVGQTVSIRLLGPLGLRAALDLLVPLGRPEFTIGGQRVTKPEPLGVRAFLGLGLHI